MTLFESLEPRRLMADVTGLMLVNARSGEDIMPLTEGAVIDLINLPTLDLSVRALTTDDTRSVKFKVDGNTTATDSSGPFDIQGTKGAGYKSWTPTGGNHALSAKAYVKTKGKGTASAPVVVNVRVIDGSSAGLSVGAGSGESGPILDAMQLRFHDEFNALPEPSVWSSSLWGVTEMDDELQSFSRSALSVDDGKLAITARQESLNGKDYVSGLITTGGVFHETPPSFSFKYGYVEARIKMAGGKGVWPAFWMLPTLDSKGRIRDDDGEIDIIEVLGHRPSVAEVHVHKFGRERGDDFETGQDLTADYHTFGIDWQKNRMTWYIDGQPVFTTTDKKVIPTSSEYLILNLAVGAENSFAGAPDGSTQFPATMNVDYVRVWQKA